MKNRPLVAALAVGLVCIASQAFAFERLDRAILNMVSGGGYGCGCESACGCDNGCGRNRCHDRCHRGCRDRCGRGCGLFGGHHGCCDAAPSCAAKAPSCGYEPSCGVAQKGPSCGMEPACGCDRGCGRDRCHRERCCRERCHRDRCHRDRCGGCGLFGGHHGGCGCEAKCGCG
jgi:hypothetical protein